MSERIPKHPCPICNGQGRQTTQYGRKRRFRCLACEHCWTLRDIGGGLVELSHRIAVVLAPERPTA